MTEAPVFLRLVKRRKSRLSCIYRGLIRNGRLASDLDLIHTALSLPRQQARAHWISPQGLLYLSE